MGCGPCEMRVFMGLLSKTALIITITVRMSTTLGSPKTMGVWGRWVRLIAVLRPSDGGGATADVMLTIKRRQNGATRFSPSACDGYANPVGDSVPSPLVRTILIKDSFFSGHKYRFDGGFAVWRPEERELDVYDNDGKLLKTIILPETHKPEAA